ncbi:MAG: hypothetical protein K2Y37_26780 [Pirellulales bacterium]|nr:hypothetical protein [Pirellulales bacterium]
MPCIPLFASTLLGDADPGADDRLERLAVGLDLLAGADRHIKVTFFRGTSLRPVPSGGTGKDARWIDIHEGQLDESRMAAWLKQAAALPGWSP